MAHPTSDDLALVALGEDVAPEVAAHAEDCLACTAEIEALRHVVVVGRSLGPADTLLAPHARVWDQISAQVVSGSPTAPVRTSTGSTPSPVRDELAARRQAPRRRWAPMAAAAAAALVVGLGGGFLLRGLTSTPADTATQLNALPGWPGANGTAAVEDGPDDSRTLVVSMTMPPTTHVDGTFEVWMSDSRATDMVPMGTMASGTGRFPIPADIDLTGHPIVDVSLEPPGDTDPHHSDVSVVRGRLRV